MYKRQELDHLCSLYFREDELAYLDSLRFIKSDYVEFLSLFHLKRKYISVTKSQDYPCGIDITAKGPWLHTILFEIPVLAIVNEVYFRNTYPDLDETEGVARLERKIELLRNEPDNGGLRISDYGTRRRFSKAWQKKVLLNMKERLGGIFTGTSNVMYAKELGLNDIKDSVSEYFNHLIFAPILNNVYMRALSAVTHKDYMTRRYMWKLDY